MKKNLLMLCVLIVTITSTIKAQLSGIYTVPGSYASVAAAINDLNTQGINGPVTINIAAGYTETAPVGGYTLTVTGTLANPIIFQKNGAGTNPLITAYSGGTGLPNTLVQDGIIRLIGSDYITFDGIDLVDPNTANPATMEFGYGLFKSSVTDGCQYNTIKNCVITLNRDNNATGSGMAVDGSRAIDVVNALTGAHITALTITSASGSNSFNKFYSNTLQNCNIGIALIGYADVTPFTFADYGNDVGGGSISTGNNIINFGGAVAATLPAAGIRTFAQYNVNASYNTINNNNGSGVSHTAIIRGIVLSTATSANATVSNNTITIKSAVTSANVSMIENLSGATAANNTITITNNLITNCTNSVATTSIWYGIYNSGASAANLNISNNTFTNNVTNATSGATYLIYNTGAVTNQINYNNNVFSFSHIGTTGYSGTLYNIYNSTSSLNTYLNVNNNTFSSYNHNVTGTGSIYFFYNLASNAGLILNGNTWNNLTFNHSGAQYYMYNSSSTQVDLKVINNTINNITRNAAAGSMYGYYCGSSSLPTSTQTFSNNLISNITATVAGSGIFYGIYNTDGATSPYPLKKVFSNTISNINYNTTGTFYGMNMNYLGDGSTSNGSLVYNNLFNNLTSNGTMYGMSCGTIASPTNPFSVYTNTVSNLISNGLASTIYAGYIGGSGPYNYYKNKIVDITQNGTTGILYGLYITTSGNGNIYNNLIGSIATPSSTGANRLNGVYIAGGTNVNLSYNSVYMNSTSTGLNFGSNAIYASTTPNVNLRNNIFVNNCIPTGTEFAVAYRRSTTTLTTYSATSNNNLFYAGTPSASNLIYHDGTTPQQNLSAYKTVVTPRDAVSVTENPTFQSTTGSSPNYLNINTVVPTQIESGAAAVSGITDDYIGTIRNAGTPDIGAWEGNFVTSADLLPPSFLSYGFTSSACNLTSRTYTMNITDVSGVAGGALAPRVYYKVNNNAYVSTQGTLTAGNATNGVWTFSMSYSGSLYDVISFYTVAQDIAAIPNLGASPNTGFVGVDVNNITTPPTNPTTYTLVGSLAGTYSVGATGSFTTLTAASWAYNNSCLTGPVTFELIDPTYSSNENFPIIFTNNPYASSINSLLIIPTTGMNVSITGSTTASSTIKFLNTKYITIDGLNSGGSSISVANPNTISSGVIWLASTSAVGPGNTNTGIKNLTITGGANTSGNYGIIAGVDGLNPTATAGIDNDNVSVIGNKITTAYYGIYALGTGTTASGLDNWTINNNSIGPVVSSTANIGYQGIYLSNLNIAAVTNNTISNVQGTSAYVWGINLAAGVRNATVNLNSITSIKYTGTGGYGGLGIDVNVSHPAANITIQNNMISDITGDGWSGFTAGAFAGIRVAPSGSVGGLNIQNNSIALNQSTVIAGYNTTCLSAAIYFGALATNIDLRNNILYSDVQYSTNLNSKTYAIYSAAPATAFNSIDNNDYYTGGTQGNLAFIAAASQTNMAMVVSSFGQNSNSQNLIPTFNGLNDLHLVPANNAQIDGTGTPITGITIDIDNQIRNVTTPDIGADEFTAPTCTTASSGTLTASSYSICNNNIVTISTTGASTGAGTIYQWMVSNAASGPYSNVTGGSGANTPTYITSALPTNTLYYVLKTVCSALSLTNTSSQATVIINPIPGATVSPMTPICAGQNLTFTSTTNIGTNFMWTGPNSFTSNIQNPVLANATSSANGVYTLVVTALNCSSPAQTVAVTVNYTNLGINAAPSYFCSSGTTTLSVLGNANTYTWSTSATTSSIVESVSTTTVYSVAGTGTSNCLANASVTITVINPTITTVGASVCGTTAIATLTANSFGPITWYASASSTVPIGTGNTFTANAAVTTTYYAQANSTNTGSLFTTLAAGNGASGNMFDIIATNAITINSVEMHFATANITTTVEVWYRPGSFVGFESSNTGWTLAYTSTVLTNGTGVLTPIPGTFAINVPSSSTYALYVTTTNGSPTTNYTNGTLLGNLYTSNSDLQLYEGKGGGYFSVINSPRVFNGKLNYTKPGCTSPVAAVVLTVNPTTPTMTAISSNSTICAGTNVTLTASGVDTYTWSTNATTSVTVFSPTTTATYTVQGYSNLCNTTQTAALSVTVNALPTVSLSASTGTICSGSGSIALTGSPAGGIYSGTAVTGNLLSIANAGTFTPMYSYTNSTTGCSNTATTTVKIYVCTSINEKLTTPGLRVYPNPNTGSFTIETNTEVFKTIEIIDITGRVVLSEQSDSAAIQMNINELANGVYNVRIKSENGIDMIKVIKQ